MIRRAFTMRLKPGSLAEYTHHHDNIWPDLVAEIERSGIARITTFQRDLDLFLVSEISNEKAWDKLWNSAVHRRWAEVMEPLMHLRDDGIVDSGELTEIFHLTTGDAKRPARSKKPHAKKAVKHEPAGAHRAKHLAKKAKAGKSLPKPVTAKKATKKTSAVTRKKKSSAKKAR